MRDLPQRNFKIMKGLPGRRIRYGLHGPRVTPSTPVRWNEKEEFVVDPKLIPVPVNLCYRIFLSKFLLNLLIKLFSMRLSWAATSDVRCLTTPGIGK